MSINEFYPYIFVLFIIIGLLLFLKKYFDIFLELKRKELAILSSKMQTANVNIEAYQRMILFIERMKPTQLVKKFDEKLSPTEYVFLINKSIEQEFDYNKNQEPYILPELWNLIVEAKDFVQITLQKELENNGSEESLKIFKSNFLLKMIENDKINNTLVTLQNNINNKLK